MKSIRYEYKILRDKGLIIRYFSGRVTLEDLYKFIELTGNEKEYTPTMVVINDMRDTEIIVDVDKVGDYVKKLKENAILYAKRKIVFLTDTPNQVVFSTYLDQIKNDPLINIITVSTLESAMEYLDLSKADYSLFDNILKKFRENR